MNIKLNNFDFLIRYKDVQYNEPPIRSDKLAYTFGMRKKKRKEIEIALINGDNY